MIRRLFTILPVFSFLLCAAICLLWTRNGKYYEAVEITSHGGEHLVFYSVIRIGMSWVAKWPEQAGVRYRGYRADNFRTIKPGSLQCTVAATAKKVDLLVGEFRNGTEILLVDDRGQIWRGPPYLKTLAGRPRSQPLRFWSFEIDCWVAATAFGIMPLWMVIRFSHSRVRREIRRRRKRCPKCGAMPTAKGNT